MAARRTSSSSNPSKGAISARVSLFSVIVPVLSEQRTSTPAISSIATSLLTIASRWASAVAPTAIVIERTAGSAAGIAATIRTRANWRVSKALSCRMSETMKTIATRTIASTIR